MSKYTHADYLLDKYFRVLDFGFVGLIDYLGHDRAVENAARVSYQKSTRKISDTTNLINYLVRNHHTSPLEQCSVTFHIRAPLYIIQQILRHRTAKLNQESHRYSEVRDINQLTKPDMWRQQSTENKQGSGKYLSDDIGEKLSNQERKLINLQRAIYKKRINVGVAREQARKDIPVSTYSSMYWTMDLNNLFHFLSLRCDTHAQLEIREYANIMAGFIKEIFPICFDAWLVYKFNAVTFSSRDRLLLNYILRNNLNRNQYESLNSLIHIHNGMSNREYNEFWRKLEQSTVSSSDFKLNLDNVLPSDLIEGEIA